jgi:outer membrane protein assembly factor BamB
MPTMLVSGRILIFDNGSRREHTRVIEIDPTSGEIVWQYPVEPDPEFFSWGRGSNQRLANGNTLLCEAEDGHVTEVTPAGETVWEFWNPVFTEKGRKLIYRFHRISLEQGASLIEAGRQ